MYSRTYLIASIPSFDASKQIYAARPEVLPGTKTRLVVTMTGVGIGGSLEDDPRKHFLNKDVIADRVGSSTESLDCLVVSSECFVGF